MSSQQSAVSSQQSAVSSQQSALSSQQSAVSTQLNLYHFSPLSAFASTPIPIITSIMVFEIQFYLLQLFQLMYRSFNVVRNGSAGKGLEIEQAGIFPPDGIA